MNSLRSSADTKSGGTLLNRRLGPVSFLTEKLVFSAGSLWRCAISVNSEKSFIAVSQAQMNWRSIPLYRQKNVCPHEGLHCPPRAQLRRSRDNLQGYLITTIGEISVMLHWGDRE